MFRQILYLTGLDRKLRSLKERIEGQALRTLDYAKAVAVRTSIGAGLALTAVLLMLWALVGLMVALFFWLQPEVGSAAAAAMVAGGLLLIAASLGVAAAIVFRREIEVQPLPDSARDDQAFAEGREFATADEVPLRPKFGEEGYRPRHTVTRSEAASLFGLARPFASPLKTGVEPIDNILDAAAPKAQEAAVDAVARAASLVRYGDRTTVATILGTAMAIGWLMARTADRSRGH